MVTVYVGTYEIQTNLFRTRRTYQFKTLEDRLAFEHKAGALGVKRVGSNIEHTLTVKEAFDDLVKEKAMCDDIASGHARGEVA